MATSNLAGPSPGRFSLLAAGVLLAAGCSAGGEPSAPSGQASASWAELVISDPAQPAAASGRASLVEAIAYASLPPGTLPDAESVQLTNTASGAVVDAPVVGGGFDPVPVPASVGDSLAIRVRLRDGRGERLFYAKVPPKRPPVIVRSDPSVGRRDVPLNARMLVVFSEPLADAVVADSAVQLSAGDVRVSGTLAFADDARLTLSFTPSDPLSPGTDYTLRLTPAIRDRDGDPLDVPRSITFATAAPPAAEPTGQAPGSSPVTEELTWLERVGVQQSSSGFTGSRIVVAPGGGFALEYFRDGAPDTVRYEGDWNVTDSSVVFMFLGANQPMFDWAATGTVHADTMHVAFNPYARTSGLEDGDFVLSRGVLYHEIAPIPQARAGARAVAWNGSIYLLGGVDETGNPAPEILAYEPAANRWRSAGRLERAVWDPGVAVVGDRIYVLGGETSDRSGVADVQVFDPAAGTVIGGPPLPFARMEVATAVLDGRIHVMGGRRSGTSAILPTIAIADHDVLDPATGAWSSLAPVPEAGRFGAAVIGGRIHLAEGSGSVLTYDAAGDVWSVGPRVGGIWSGAAVDTLDGRMYKVAGIAAWGCHGVVRRVAADLSETWVTQLVPPRCFAAVASVGGSLYLFGGTRETDNVFPTSPAIRAAGRLVVRP